MLFIYGKYNLFIGKSLPLRKLISIYKGNNVRSHGMVYGVISKMEKKTAYVAKTPDQNGYIDYTDDEHAVWRDLYSQQITGAEKYAAQIYRSGLEQLSVPADRIPQCAELSARLQPKTGWTVAPVPALIGFGRFFTMLSERRFPAASFIRSREHFDYIKEPDIFHEIFGHTPLLMDPEFAAFSQRIGETGLTVETKDYSWLIRLYWFTVEFGLTRENGCYKALGSGLNSSPTELIYSVESPIPERREFNLIDVLRTPYRIDIHQPIYFVIEDFNDVLNAVSGDLLGSIRKAQSLGLFAPTYEALTA